jgi:hypothetical protein
VSSNPSVGIFHDASTYSGALIANYVINPKFQLAGRFEYIGTDGHPSDVGRPTCSTARAAAPFPSR